MLKCDFGNMHREIELLDASGVALLHLDVMDGHFVPNLSYGPPVIERLRQLTELPFDTHLMISDPGKYLDDYLSAGCDCVTFHYEAVSKPGSLLERIRSRDAVAGLALNPGTPVEAIRPYLPLCDLVLVMSVEPGFGGQKFQSSAVEKLRQLREWLPETTLLSVDGGIGLATIAETARAGADLFVVGSAIFDTPDYSDSVRELSALARGASQSETNRLVPPMMEN